MGEATPSPQEPSILVQELLAHVAWVRRLATELVAGAADADDVAQETWRRALERPPQHAHQLRHWLALAARNVARQLQRAARTRARHEASAVPAPHESSSDDLVARAQMQRRVVDAVLALEANYREVVLARFFDDQKPSHIAARLGLPVETVKTRLKRGLERVRGQLVADRPDAPSRREVARALAPLLAMRALDATTRVMTAWKCAAAIVAAAALALVVLRVPGSSAPSDVRAAESVAASSGAQEPSATPPLAAERVPVGATAEVVAAPPCALLRGFVVDERGGIVPAATITWREGDSVSQVAIDEGEYAIAGLAGGDVSFNVGAKGFQPGNFTLELARLDLGIHINIGLDALRLDAKRHCKGHMAIGRITYPGEGEYGYLLYLKSSCTGDEDDVIGEYRGRNEAFPHESTADQFFDEGQFEAYRSLGQHIGEDAIRALLPTHPPDRKVDFAELVRSFQAAWELEHSAEGRGAIAPGAAVRAS